MRINPKLSRNRSPRWRFTLLDDRDVELRDLRGVVTLSGEIAARERLGGSASLVLDERGDGIDWMKHRVRFTYDPGIMGVEPWPMVGTSPAVGMTALSVKPSLASQVA